MSVKLQFFNYLGLVTGIIGQAGQDEGWHIFICADAMIMLNSSEFGLCYVARLWGLQ